MPVSPLTPRPALPIPDLLCAEPALRVDGNELRQALVFGFAVESSLETFEGIQGRAALPASSWDRATFEHGLFLEQLIERCLAVRIAGRPYAMSTPYLLRVICAPPRAAEIVSFRRGVLEELAAGGDLRRDFETAYTEIVGLRALLTTGHALSEALRRLEILRAIHRVMMALVAPSLVGAASGVARLGDFGRAVVEGDAFRRLDALLDHDDHLGTLDLRVRVGADGELRRFDIVAVRENDENPFHKSPIARWIATLRLFMRGFRVNSGVVLEHLFDDIFTALEGSLILVFQLLSDMEFYLSGLGFRDLATARGLAVSFPEFVDPSVGVNVTDLFNPLLLGETETPVPCDLQTQDAGAVVIVTGPNSGGKTRLLQSIALLQLLGESGLLVPAREARIPRVPGLFVSILDDVRADQPEGQLGMELLRIRRMFEHLAEGSLVLLDELCSGTNPSEGEEIARLVISLLPDLGAQVFVTTHLLSFAARLSSEHPIAGLAFLQVELDEAERPTYRFAPGVARTSLAQKTAARLGVTRDELLALIAKRKRAGA